MRNHIIKSFVLAACTLSLTACGFFDKDNTPTPTPLTQFSPEVKPQRLWSTRTGSSIGNEYLKTALAVGDTAIFTAGIHGVVTSTDKLNGHINWQTNTRISITSGPGIGEGIVVVGGRKGDVIALQQTDGRQLWRTSVPGEILAKPAIGQGTIVIKAANGLVRALSARDGHELWSAQQVEPNLILRGASAPIILDHHVIVGFANGNLAKLGLNDGQSLWQQSIATPEGAFAIQRMIDIDADPVVFNHQLYAATYQGKIDSLDLASGKILWSHDISSYTGMVADEAAVYITDAKGYVWSFDANTGSINWRQNRLEARVISGPAMMGNEIVVGDAEGYLHWLSKTDGHFVARESIGSTIYAAPVVDHNILYTLTNTGYLVAYTLR